MSQFVHNHEKIVTLIPGGSIIVFFFFFFLGPQGGMGRDRT